jgi:L-iditol 2-dehydrogenase
VISIGKNPYKLNIAKEIGADFTLNIKDFPNEDGLIEKINSFTNNYGPEVVIEAVGLPEIWELATKIVCRGGLVNFFGGCKKGTKIELDTFKLHYDELKVLGVFHHTPEYAQKALSLLSDNFIQKVVGKIITKKMPLEELENAFLLHESGEVIQVAIKPK